MDLIIGIVIFAAYGAVIALVSQLPPVQNFSRRGLRQRVSTAILTGLLAFIIPFLLITYRNAREGYQIGIDPQQSAIVNEVAANRDALNRELWIREVIPPALQKSCYTDPAIWTPVPGASESSGGLMKSPESVCDLADTIGSVAPQDYWKYLAMFLASGVAAATMALVLTRPKAQDASEGRK